MGSSKLKYIDNRPIYIPLLDKYRGGIVLPSNTNIIDVSEGEKKNLLKMKNGNKPCFEEIKESKRIFEKKEVDDVSR